MVSVIVPTYNRGNLLGRALNSIVNQTYDNIEIIVVDDFSKDNTYQVVRQFKDKGHNIKYIYNKKNLGPSISRNIGIAHSKGKYIAFLDSDDEWLDIHLEESINVLEKENAYVSSAFWYERKENGEETAFYNENHIKEAVKTLSPKVCDGYYKFDRNFFKYTIMHDIYCYHINTIVFNRMALDEIKLFNKGLRASEDMEFTLRLIERYGLCLINNFHFIYCKGNDNLYWFVERGILDPKMILEDYILIKKLSFCNYNKCKMLILRKKLIKNSSTIEDGELYLKKCNEKIARKYFAIAYMYKEINVAYSLYYTLKAIIYDRQPLYIKYFFAIFRNRKEFKVERIDIY